MEHYFVALRRARLSITAQLHYENAVHLWLRPCYLSEGARSRGAVIFSGFSSLHMHMFFYPFVYSSDSLIMHYGHNSNNKQIN